MSTPDVQARSADAGEARHRRLCGPTGRRRRGHRRVRGPRLSGMPDHARLRRVSRNAERHRHQHHSARRHQYLSAPSERAQAALAPPPGQRQNTDPGDGRRGSRRRRACRGPQRPPGRTGSRSIPWAWGPSAGELIPLPTGRGRGIRQGRRRRLRKISAGRGGIEGHRGRHRRDLCAARRAGRRAGGDFQGGVRLRGQARSRSAAAEDLHRALPMAAGGVCGAALREPADRHAASAPALAGVRGVAEGRGRHHGTGPAAVRDDADRRGRHAAGTSPTQRRGLQRTRPLTGPANFPRLRRLSNNRSAARPRAMRSGWPSKRTPTTIWAMPCIAPARRPRRAIPETTIEKWTEAVKAYETALELRADDADSKYNRDLVKRKIDALRRPPPPPQNQGSGKGQSPRRRRIRVRARANRRPAAPRTLLRKATPRRTAIPRQPAPTAIRRRRAPAPHLRRRRPANLGNRPSRRPAR